MEWGLEQSEAFEQLKNYITTNLLVTMPKPEILLLLYVRAFEHAVSAVLVHEKQEQQGII